MTKSWMCLAKYYSHFSDTLHFQTVPGNGFREISIAKSQCVLSFGETF